MCLYFSQYDGSNLEHVQLSNVNMFTIEPITKGQRILSVTFFDSTVKRYTIYDWQVISGDLNDML